MLAAPVPSAKFAVDQQFLELAPIKAERSPGSGSRQATELVAATVVVVAVGGVVALER